LIEVGEEKLTKLIKYQYGKFKYRENVFVAHFGEFFAKKNQPHTWTMDLAGCRLVLKRTHAIHHRYKAEFFFSANEHQYYINWLNKICTPKDETIHYKFHCYDRVSTNGRHDALEKNLWSTLITQLQ